MEELFLPPIERKWINNVRQTEIHIVEPLVPQLSSFEVKIAIDKLKIS
jgi:hypothetical protein